MTEVKGRIDPLDYDRVNAFCEVAANQLLPRILEDIEAGKEPSDFYVTLIDRLGGEPVDRRSAMWGCFTTAIAVAFKIHADERARRLAT